MENIENKKTSEFWKNQPVLQNKLNKNEEETEIKMSNLVDFELDKIDLKSYNLPSDLKWNCLNTEDDNEWKELSEFLKNHYINIGSQWSFYHNPNFLKKALTAPGFKKEWILGIKYKDKYMGFISAIQVKISISDEKSNENVIMNIAQVDFMCVHKNLRNKKMAPILIKEITRRLQLEGLQSAIYTGTKELSKPLSYSAYYVRYLNLENLFKNNYILLNDEKEIENFRRKYKFSSDDLLKWIP